MLASLVRPLRISLPMTRMQAVTVLEVAVLEVFGHFNSLAWPCSYGHLMPNNAA